MRYFVVFSLLFFLICPASADAQSYNASSEYSLGSSVDSYARDILVKHPMKDYVVWRGDRYDYYIAYGDLDYSSGTFSGKASVIRYYNYNGTTISDPVQDDTFQLRAGDTMVKSNLSDRFPVINGARDYYSLSIVCILVGVILGKFFYSLLTVWRR